MELSFWLILNIKLTCKPTSKNIFDILLLFSCPSIRTCLRLSLVFGLIFWSISCVPMINKTICVSSFGLLCIDLFKIFDNRHLIPLLIIDIINWFFTFMTKSPILSQFLHVLLRYLIFNSVTSSEGRNTSTRLFGHSNLILF